MRIVLAALCLLTACSRGPVEPPPERAPAQSPQPAPVAPAPAVSNDGRPVIVAFGDSITAGFGLDPGHSYPDFLQQQLDARGYRYRVVNAGVSGDTTAGGVVRMEEVLSYKPAVVVLELGGNDGLRGIRIAVTRENLEQMVTTFTGAGVKVLLAGMTLPPNYGPDYIRQFEQAYRELAKKHRLPLIPFVLGEAVKHGMMQPDGIHPNVEGSKMLARVVREKLEPLLSRE